MFSIEGAVDVLRGALLDPSPQLACSPGDSEGRQPHGRTGICVAIRANPGDSGA